MDADAQVRREVHPLGSTRLRGWLLLEGRADRAASQAVTAGLVSLLSLEIERRYTLDTVERRRRAKVFDRPLVPPSMTLPPGVCSPPSA